MPLEVKQEKGENSRSIVRRFSRRMRQSGILRRARQIRFRAPHESDQAKKKSALRRERIKKEYQEMRKLGKVKKWR